MEGVKCSKKKTFECINYCVYQKGLNFQLNFVCMCLCHMILSPKNCWIFMKLFKVGLEMKIKNVDIESIEK